MLRFLLSLPLVFLFSLNSHSIPFEGQKMLISAPTPYAVEAGKKVVTQGGNAVDVATAVALTLAVTTPYFAAFGGGGFALIKQGEMDVEVLDFRETAPQKTHSNFFVNLKDGSSQVGGAAIGIPGIPLGLYELHKKHGKLSWAKLFEEPLRLARRGFHVSGEWVNRTELTKPHFNSSGKKYFFKNGEMLKAGDLLLQENLAKFLDKYKRRGPSAFYEGEVAKDIVNSIQRENGVLTLEDLKNYKSRWLKPLVHKFKDLDIYLMPPPSSGGLVIKTALSLIESLQVDKQKEMSIDEFHLLAEILNRSFRGREMLGDPDFHNNPIELLTSEKYLSELSRSIKVSKATTLPPLSSLKNYKESSETTHFSVLDKDGNSVSMTLTLNGNYGSGVVTDKFGIALNNEMDDFTTLPGKPNMYGLVQGQGNLVEPGKRPLSSMSPTLVAKDGKIILSLGAPGGPTIISGVLQVLYRSLIRGVEIDRAIQTPRVHHQFLPNTLFIDEWRFQPATVEGLKRKGHKLEEKRFIGRVSAVRLKDDGILEAAFDSRGEGASGGY